MIPYNFFLMVAFFCLSFSSKGDVRGYFHGLLLGAEVKIKSALEISHICISSDRAGNPWILESCSCKTAMTVTAVSKPLVTFPGTQTALSWSFIWHTLGLVVLNEGEKHTHTHIVKYYCKISLCLMGNKIIQCVQVAQPSGLTIWPDEDTLWVLSFAGFCSTVYWWVGDCQHN